MPTSRRWAHGAAAWAALFAGLHLHWALGGSLGLAESAGEQLAAERPGWFVAGGLYGVALLLLAAAGLAVLLLRRPGPGRWVRLLPLLAVGVGAVLALRAAVVHVLLLSDAGHGGGAISPAQRTWTLWVWDPWFLLGGALFVLAGLAARRRWRTG